MDDQKLTLDEYMELLQSRYDEWMADNPDSGKLKRLPPLLTWFIRAGDEERVILPATPAKKPPTKRKYRPASYWRAELDRITEQMARLGEPLIPDRAAAGGAALGHKRTRRIQALQDGRLARYVALERKRSHAESMLRSAEDRERRQADTPTRPKYASSADNISQAE